jgi:hypothetical protein
MENIKTDASGTLTEGADGYQRMVVDWFFNHKDSFLDLNRVFFF